MGLAEEAMDLVDTCITGDSLKDTDTTFVDWKKARVELKTMIFAADAEEDEA